VEFIEIHGVRCSPAQRRAAAPGVVETKILIEPSLERLRTLIGFQVDVFIPHAAPQTLYGQIVDPAPLAVHADGDLVTLEHVGEGLGCELRSLIGN
jgi:hypothetical protein